MVEGLAAEYLAQTDWIYNQMVVHPLAARRERSRRELRVAQTARTGRRWWARLVFTDRRTNGGLRSGPRDGKTRAGGALVAGRRAAEERGRR